ncbi:hypothetical protein [Streptomyces sp. NPDC002215]|uniref:hypothetical protein n=1 Tax=Streptomyces sp. NPDC002215 TaxID=3154412 RepID=UPI0033272164
MSELNHEARFPEPDPVPSSTPERIPSGDWAAFAATVALVPFLQALAQTFGNRLANGAGPWTRLRTRRFLRRQIRNGGDDSRHAPTRESRRTHLVLTHESGARVLLDVKTPPEALEQLTTVEFSGLLPDAIIVASAIWNGEQWCVTVYYREGSGEDLRVRVHLWDAERCEWMDAETATRNHQAPSSSDERDGS